MGSCERAILGVTDALRSHRTQVRLLYGAPVPSQAAYAHMTLHLLRVILNLIQDPVKKEDTSTGSRIAVRDDGKQKGMTR